MTQHAVIVMFSTEFGLLSSKTEAHATMSQRGQERKPEAAEKRVDRGATGGAG